MQAGSAGIVRERQKSVQRSDFFWLEKTRKIRHVLCDAFKALGKPRQVITEILHTLTVVAVAPGAEVVVQLGAELHISGAGIYHPQPAKQYEEARAICRFHNDTDANRDGRSLPTRSAARGRCAASSSGANRPPAPDFGVCLPVRGV